jgi:hypothetical protein
MGRFGIVGLILFVAFLAPWQTVGSAHAGSGDRFAVEEGLAKLFEKPDEDSRVVAHLEKGRRLVALQEKDGWIKVLAFGKGETGWIPKTSLRPEKPAGTFAAEPRVVEKPHARFALEIRGSRQDYRARCKTVSAEGERVRRTFEGRAPSRILFHDRAVSCRVDLLTQHGSGLTVALYKQGRRLPLGRNSTHSFPGCVKVRSDGPWGEALGRRCSRLIIADDFLD